MTLTTVASRRTASLPRWLTNAGFVAGPVALAGAVFMPLAITFLWLVGLSIVLTRGHEISPVGGSTPPAVDQTVEEAAGG